MTPNPFDQACRYLLRLWGEVMLAWLLRMPKWELEFVEWVDTRHVPWPGEPDRVCDTVAYLTDPRKGGLPWASVVEFQIQPDELMFGRGLSYLGDLWCDCKPTALRGDRFCVGLVVVNLTGKGQSDRRMQLRGTPLLTHLGVAEWNLATLPARTMLKQIEAGKLPRCLLAWLPLFKGGAHKGMIKEWWRLADVEKRPEHRRSLGLAVVFAEAVGCGDLWRDGLKEWDMIESKIVNEWKAEGEKKGEMKGMVRLLLQGAESRFGALPADLVTRIRACTDEDKLLLWIQRLVKGPSLDEFRKLVNED